MDVVLATGNTGKVAELQAHLQSLGYHVLPQGAFNVPDAVEDGLTFIENALIKARHAAKLTGLPAIADDSGLEVDALKGAPGIYSARYAEQHGVGQGDDANIEALLHHLKIADAIDPDARRARFRCALVYLRHTNDPAPIIAQGVWEGVIALERAGDHGFGYDPVFFVPSVNCTAAQLRPEQKKPLSHRGQALSILTQQLSDLTNTP